MEDLIFKGLMEGEDVWVVTPSIKPYLLRGEVYSLIKEQVGVETRYYVRVRLQKSGAIIEFRPNEVFSYANNPHSTAVALERLYEVLDSKTFTQ